MDQRGHDKYELELFEKAILNCFEIIRGRISGSDYYVVLFLLWARKEKVVFSFNEKPHNLRDYIISQVRDYTGDYQEIALELLNEFEIVVNSLEDDTLFQLGQAIESVDEGALRAHFTEVFEDVLYAIAKVEGRSGGEHLLPYEISRFVTALFRTENASVYNPFAGLASFGVYLHKDAAYIGEEINPRIKVLGKLRLIVHGKMDHRVLYENDSIRHWNYAKRRYDLIIANPPFGRRLLTDFSGEHPDISSAEHFFIHQSLQDLTPDGKVISVVPQGFLFRPGAEYRLRKYLVEKDLLEMVISLPGGVLSNTAIPLSVVVINKGKRDKGCIRFIQGENFFETISKRERKLDYQALLDEVWREEETGSLHIVPNAEVKLYDFNLSVNRYFLGDIETQAEGFVKTIFLEDVLKEARGGRPSVSKGKSVRARDLADDTLDFKLKVHRLDETEITRNVNAITESVLLVSARGTSLRPTFFEYQDESIYIPADIFSFRIDTDKIDVAYLIDELYSIYVNKQLAAIRYGTTVPTFNLNDFLRIKIRYVPIELQLAKVQQTRYELYQKMKQEIEQFRKQHGFENEIYEQNSFLRHSIAGPLKNLRGAFKNMQSIIEQQILPKLPDVYSYKTSSNSNLDMRRYLDIIDRDLYKITENTRRNGLEAEMIEQAKLEPVDLCSFIDTYIHEVQGRENLNYRISFTFDQESFRDIEGNIITPEINGNQDLLRILFNNLIENAEQHAFKGRKAEENRIEFFLTFSFEDLQITLLVSNTGKPFPPDFSTEMFARRGSTAGNNAGDGFGGWYISEIIEKHNGSFDIIDETGPEGLPETDLATSLEIIFPIRLNE